MARATVKTSTLAPCPLHFRWADVCGLSFVGGSNPSLRASASSSVVEQPPQGVIPHRPLPIIFLVAWAARRVNRNPQPGGCMAHNHQWDEIQFEITSKRRKGFPSETQVKRGVRIVHGNKELSEKLGRNDLCPCGSGRSFQELLPALWPVRRCASSSLLSATDQKPFLRAEEPGLSSVKRTNPRFTNLSAV